MGISETENLIQIYTDGACKGNPGPGGWAWVTEINGELESGAGGEPHTTNNRMELTAAIMALYHFQDKDIVINSDSKYVIDGIVRWIKVWKLKNFKRIKNVELWKELDELATNHNGTLLWTWVRGHDGNRMNELADELAVNNIEYPKE